MGKRTGKFDSSLRFQKWLAERTLATLQIIVPEYLAFVDDVWWRIAGQTEEKARKHLRKLLKRKGIEMPADVDLIEDSHWLRKRNKPHITFDPTGSVGCRARSVCNAGA